VSAETNHHPATIALVGLACFKSGVEWIDFAGFGTQWGARCAPAVHWATAGLGVLFAGWAVLAWRRGQLEVPWFKSLVHRVRSRRMAASSAPRRERSGALSVLGILAIEAVMFGAIQPAGEDATRGSTLPEVGSPNAGATKPDGRRPMTVCALGSEAIDVARPLQVVGTPAAAHVAPSCAAPADVRARCRARSSRTHGRPRRERNAAVRRR
jgi:hypothetical protein